MSQERQPLPRSPQCRPYFPIPIVDLIDMDAVHQKQERPSAVLGCGRRCSQPVTVKASGMLGKVLDIVGERDGHRVLEDLGLGSSE